MRACSCLCPFLTEFLFSASLIQYYLHFGLCGKPPPARKPSLCPTWSRPFSLLQVHLGSETQNSALGFVHQARLSFPQGRAPFHSPRPHPDSAIFLGTKELEESSLAFLELACLEFSVPIEKVDRKIGCSLSLEIVWTGHVN